MAFKVCLPAGFGAGLAAAFCGADFATGFCGADFPFDGIGAVFGAGFDADFGSGFTAAFLGAAGLPDTLPVTACFEFAGDFCDFAALAGFLAGLGAVFLVAIVNLSC